MKKRYVASKKSTNVYKKRYVASKKSTDVYEKEMQNVEEVY